MDSKLPQLDPKLKEAYDRVLNGQNVQPLQSPTQAPQSPSLTQPQQPQMSAQPEPMGPQTISSAPQGGVATGPATPIQSMQQPQPGVSSEIHAPIQPIQQQPNPTPPPVQNIGGSIAYNAGGTTAQTVVKKGKPNIMHFLLGLGAVVFLIGYTFIWIFIFKIKLPFLSA